MMKKIFFFFPSDFIPSFFSLSVIHPLDMYKMDLVPEGYASLKSSKSANPFVEGLKRGKWGLKTEISQKVFWLISDAYSNSLILLNRPKKWNFFTKDADLVYSRQFLLDTNVPYLLDMEHPAVFCGFNQYALDSKSFSASLRKELENDNLRRILPMSNTAKQTLFNFVKSEKVVEKTETVYPIVKSPDKIKKKEGIAFLFIGKVFYQKGGLETLICFDRLSKKYNVSLNFLGPVPKGIYEKYSKNKQINFYSDVPYDKVKELFQNSTCLVFPSMYDTLGFVVLEAFSYGLSVITVDSFALPELVEDNVRGIVIKPPFNTFRPDGGYVGSTRAIQQKYILEHSQNPPQQYLDSLYESMEKIILDSSLRNKFSQNAIKETREGKFSEKTYKEKISKIYESM
ncbi:MAG: glycosyltransferase family 4 protein [Candidatus Micrarchaeota archaeon]|nr:glycosyltransferase family 4 protein [Candidatus Micrarchaeota archaeon]